MSVKGATGEQGQCHDILKCISWMKMLKYWLEFHWSLFLRIQLTIRQHWFRQLLGAEYATNHHLNQKCQIYRPIYASLGLNGLRSDRKWNYLVVFLVKKHERVNTVWEILCESSMSKRRLIPRCLEWTPVPCCTRVWRCKLLFWWAWHNVCLIHAAPVVGDGDYTGRQTEVSRAWINNYIPRSFTACKKLILILDVHAYLQAHTYGQV